MAVIKPMIAAQNFREVSLDFQFIFIIFHRPLDNMPLAGICGCFSRVDLFM